MSDSHPNPEADVEQLLVQTLEDEERRLAELENRVARLQSGTLPAPPRSLEEVEEKNSPPSDPGVTRAELDDARHLLQQSGEHLRSLQGRLALLEGRDDSDAARETQSEDTDRYRLVLGPGQEAGLELVPERDAFDFEQDFAALDARDEEERIARERAEFTPPVTHAGWGESTPLSRPSEDGLADPADGFRAAEDLPDPDELETPRTAAGWGGEPAPRSSASAPQSGPTIQPAPGPAPRVVLPPPTDVIQVPPALPPQYLVSAGPAAVAGQVAANLDASLRANASGGAQRPPTHAEGNPDRYDLGNKFGGGREPSLRELWLNQQRILERLDALAEGLDGVAHSQQEVATLRQRAERAERVSAAALAQAKARSERLESAISGLSPRPELAPAPTQTERASTAGAAKPAVTPAAKPVVTPAAKPAAKLASAVERESDPHPGATQTLVRLLREAIAAQEARAPEPAATPEPARPDPLVQLRERLLAMGSEHQQLVQRHASLLEQLLALLE